MAKIAAKIAEHSIIQHAPVSNARAFCMSIHALLRGCLYAAVAACVLQVNGVASAAAAEAPAKAAAAPPAAPQPNNDATYDQETARRSALLEKMSPVTDALLNTPANGDWLTWRRAGSSLGFSPLTQINTKNVGQLRAAWSWTLHQSGNEITPLAHDGVLFIHSGDAVQAFDGASGDLLWEYVRPLPESMKAASGQRTKGIAIYQHTVFVPTIDGHIVGLDAKTGKVLWDREVVAPEALARGVGIVAAPIVGKGRVMIGVSPSASLKGGCYIVGLDAQTGEEKWRFHTLAQPGEPGGDSWNGLPAEGRFGGAIWTGGSYDSELNLAYFGVGNTYNTTPLLTPPYQPGPANAALYTNATVALNPETGALVWHYQHIAREVWDMDWALEQTLIDMPIDGTPRKLLVTGSKAALFDVIDRTNGSYVFSRDIGLQNIVVGIDPKTGEKTINPALTPVSGETKILCPSPNGFRAWPATAYNPQTHILYVPIVENCGTFTWTARDAAAIANGGSDLKFTTTPMPNSDGKFGRIQAINLQTGKTVWTTRQRAPISGSMLATAGGVAFNASRDRYFNAYDQRNGKLLWQTRLNMVGSSSPITYSVNGEQYVAVTAGAGAPFDRAFSILTPEIVNPTGTTTLWVFKLP